VRPVRQSSFRPRAGLTWAAAALSVAGLVRPAAGVLAPEESQLLGRLKGAEMWRWVQRLSAPGYDGRRAGTPGASRAVETLAAQFGRIGLEQPVSAGGYRQRFTMSYSLLRSPWDRRATLADSRGAVKLRLEYPDFVPSACSVAGQAVSLGYGIHRPDRRWDDYAGVSLRGKVAVFWQGEPSGVSQSIEARCRTARERGALGCLVIARTPLQESADGMKDRGVSGLVADHGLTADFPILQLRRETAARLFGRPVPPPAALGSRLSALGPKATPADPFAKQLVPTPGLSREPRAKSREPRALGRISLSIPASIDPARPLANVVGALTGRDKTLRDQWVVFSAHLDHLGRTGSSLYCGADDDASGVAVVCAVAEAMAHLETRPRRSVLFALWNGEECGLLGSRHYVDRPLVPLEQTVGVLQLDMVGVGRSNAFLTSSRRLPASVPGRAEGRSRAFELFENAAHTLRLGLLSDGVTGISDHIPFVRAGVPAVVVTTAGLHPNYHSPGDRPELVQPQALENCARLMALSVWRIANDAGAAPAIAANPRSGRPIR
jgi:Peptidase family M28